LAWSDGLAKDIVIVLSGHDGVTFKPNIPAMEFTGHDLASVQDVDGLRWGPVCSIWSITALHNGARGGGFSHDPPG
jgi:hypothetical protein